MKLKRNKKNMKKTQMKIKKYTKSNLPEKQCYICNRPFSWRKKWEKNWDEIKYCSEACKMKKNQNKNDSI